MAGLMQPRDKTRWNFLTGLLTGGIGAPGDMGQAAQDTSVGLLNARMQSLDPTGQMRAMSGMHSPLQGPEVPYGSPALQKRIGGDPQAPESLLGAIGAPEITDIAKGAGLLSKLGTDLAPGGLLAQALFHGTPHRFDKFELEKIGTGEGAQAYGHGLYFAESPGVAKTYQNALVDSTPVIDANISVEAKDAIIQTFRNSDYIDFKDVPEAELKEWLDVIAQDTFNGMNDFTTAGQAEAIRLADEIQSVKPSQLSMSKGHLYEVDIPDETIGKMLDWDAPLSEQPESVRKGVDSAIRSIAANMGFDDIGEPIKWAEKNLDNSTGEGLYRAFSVRQPSTEAASKALNEAGIPGIRFLDGSSRNVVGATADGPVSRLAEKLHKENGGNLEKTLDSLMEKYPAFDRDALKKALPDTLNRKRNIVVFNPDDIRKVKRDGELVYDTGKRKK